MPAAPQNTEMIQERHVYIDASISMSGFVNPSQHTQFNELIEGLSDVISSAQLYKYGQKAGGKAPRDNSNFVIEKVSPGTELHQRQFYDLSFNPDDRLIERLANEERQILSVLVTDGVFSEPQGGTSPPVVQALQKWLDRGRVLGILIFKSSFNGPFYSERGRQMLNPLPVKDRPFYAFVLSPTEKDLRRFQDDLRRRLPEIEMRSLIFSDNAASCVPELNERLKGTYSYKRPPEVPYYWHMFDASLFAQQNPAPVSYRIKCNIAPDYPLAELRFDLAAQYYRWQKGQFQRVENTPQGFAHNADPGSVKEGASEKLNDSPAQANSGSSAMQPDVIVYFPKDPGGDYGFYHFTLEASPKALRPEILELSTRDDRLPQNAGKTFRFYELVFALTNIHFKTRLADKASPTIFVTIDNH